MSAAHTPRAHHASTQRQHYDPAVGRCTEADLDARELERKLAYQDAAIAHLEHLLRQRAHRLERELQAHLAADAQLSGLPTGKRWLLLYAAVAAATLGASVVWPWGFAS